MDFGEKLQKLRKQKELTQEELAERLYVSRTAISKWESGRGYPGIDSLRGIAKFFSVTIEDLLSGDEVLCAAEEDHRKKTHQICDTMFGLLDCSASMLLFLPLFGQRDEGIVRSVSMLALTEAQPYLRIIYFAVVIGLLVLGIMTLALQGFELPFWKKIKNTISLIWSAIGVLLFTVSLQPYASVFLFVLLAIKVVILIKRQ